MVFSSSVFLFAFLPAFLALYFIMPWRVARNVWLLAASLVFYAWGEPVYVWLMVAAIAANWLFGLAIGKTQALDGSRLGKNRFRISLALLIAAVAFDCLVIGFFKYEGFLAANMNALIGAQVVPDLELPLPIGISFYTLQALSYVIDVYRGQVAPQRNPLYLGMYVACFPQLIAGPSCATRRSRTRWSAAGRHSPTSPTACGFS